MATTLRGDDDFDTAIAQKALVQTHLNTASSQSVSANTRTNITGLNATISPSTTSKRIKITIRWNGEYSNANNYNQVYGIKRDTTDIGNPAAASSRPVGMAIVAMGYIAADTTSTPDSVMYSYIDSPATTSATTYHATLIHATAAGTLFNQRTVNDTDNTSSERLTSSIILEEVD